MRNTYFLYLILFIFYTCNNSENLSLKDITEQKRYNETKREIDKKKKSYKKEELESELKKMNLIISDSLPIQLTKLNFLVSNFPKYVFSQGEKNKILERYPIQNSEFLTISSGVDLIKNDTNDLYTIQYYQFKDSVYKKTAFYNWLDCFGKKCNSIKINEDLEKIDSKRMLVISNNNEIYILSANCGNDSNWLKLKRTLIKKIDEKTIVNQFEINCNKKLKWKTNKIAL